MFKSYTKQWADITFKYHTTLGPGSKGTQITSRGRDSSQTDCYMCLPWNTLVNFLKTPVWHDSCDNSPPVDLCEARRVTFDAVSDVGIWLSPASANTKVESIMSTHSFTADDVTRFHSTPYHSHNTVQNMIKIVCCQYLLEIIDCIVNYIFLKKNSFSYFTVLIYNFTRLRVHCGFFVGIMYNFFSLFLCIILFSHWCCIVLFYNKWENY